MAHIVTCRWCGEKFDTEKVEWTMPSRNQYYHTECWKMKQEPGSIRPNAEKDNASDEWRKVIFDFITRDLKGECNYARINQQLNEYKKKNPDWTYKGMFFALKWFYEIKHNSWDKSNGGVGILPYIYYDGTEYWRKRENAEKGIVKAIEQQIKERENRQTITVQRTEQKKPKQKYFLEED